MCTRYVRTWYIWREIREKVSGMKPPLSELKKKKKTDHFGYHHIALARSLGLEVPRKPDRVRRDHPALWVCFATKGNPLNQTRRTSPQGRPSGSSKMFRPPTQHSPRKRPNPRKDHSPKTENACGSPEMTSGLLGPCPSGRALWRGQ